MHIEMLLVEDNESDARLLREVLFEINNTVRLHVVSDGVEAVSFLTYQGVYVNAPRPHIILLDLRMPKMDGLEVLSRVKTDPWLRPIPVIVVTTSSLETDVAQSYRLMANCYLVKPDALVAFESLVHSLNEFWLKRVVLHTHQQSAQST